MTEDSMEKVSGALEDLMQRERQALLEGDLETLMRLVPEKERLLDELANAPELSRAELESMRQRMEMHGALFESALEGIRSVALRLGLQRRLKHDLQTYTRDGRKERLSISAGSSVEKRA